MLKFDRYVWEIQLARHRKRQWRQMYLYHRLLTYIPEGDQVYVQLSSLLYTANIIPN